MVGVKKSTGTHPPVLPSGSESGAQVQLRVFQVGQPGEPNPLAGWGWNAAIRPVGGHASIPDSFSYGTSGVATAGEPCHGSPLSHRPSGACP